MNRRGVLNRTQLIIDLTSLLDVIFIVLLIVICTGQRAGESGAAEAAKLVADAEALNDQAAYLESEAETAKLLYENRLDAMEHISDYILLVTAAVDYTPGTPENRHIKLIDTEDDEITSIDLSPENEEAAFSEFERALNGYMDEADGRLVVFSIDTEKILYRDEKKVERILTDLGDSYDNIVFR